MSEPRLVVPPPRGCPDGEARAHRMLDMLETAGCGEWATDGEDFATRNKVNARAQAYRRLAAEQLSVDPNHIRTRVWRDPGSEALVVAIRAENTAPVRESSSSSTLDPA